MDGYAVRAEDSGGRVGPMSNRARTQPALVEGVLASVLSEREVELSWQPVEDAQGYHIEKAVVEVWTEDQLQREKKQTPPLKEPAVAARSTLVAEGLSPWRAWRLPSVSPSPSGTAWSRRRHFTTRQPGRTLRRNVTRQSRRSGGTPSKP